MNNDNILIQAGLSEEQAVAYEALLEKGPQKAGSLASWTGIKRGLTYKVLEQLEHIGLVQKKGGTGSVAVFYPNHPSVLLDKLERDKKNLDLAKEIVGAGVGVLASKFSLLSGKPNVRFFEGEQGVREVLWDTLTTKEVVYTIADIEAITKYIPKLNDEYSELREKKNLSKKALLLDTPRSRELMKNYHTKVTEIKFISPKIQEFQTVLQIYDNKISYITLKDDSKIGIIIEDSAIYNTNRKIFDYLWDITESNAITQTQHTIDE